MKGKKNLLWILLMLSMCVMAVMTQGRMSRYIEARSTHLVEYTYFGQYNAAEYFNEFRISETWKCGKPFYQLYASKEGVSITIDKEQTFACVAYEGKSLTFAINGFTLTNARVYLADITNDGENELIYEEPMSGVEKNQGNCTVVELKTMKILGMQDFSEALLDKITVLPISQEGDDVICKITDDNHHIYFGKVKGSMEELAKGEVIGSAYHAVEYNVKEQRLRVYTCFTLENSEEGSFLGDISADYCYNPQLNTLELGDKYEVTVWNSLNNV